MPLDTRKYDRERETKRAISRRSYKCPVLKAVNKSLKDNEFMDIKHAIGVFIVDLKCMPEAAGTLDVLKKLYDIGEE